MLKASFYRTCDILSIHFHTLAKNCAFKGSLVSRLSRQRLLNVDVGKSDAPRLVGWLIASVLTGRFMGIYDRVKVLPLCHLRKKVPSLESHDFSRELKRGRERRERPRVISMRRLARGALERSASRKNRRGVLREEEEEEEEKEET